MKFLIATSLFLIASSSIAASSEGSFERGYNQGKQACNKQVVSQVGNFKCNVRFRHPYTGGTKVASAQGGTIAEAKVNLLESCAISEGNGATRCAMAIARRKVSCQ